MDKKKLLFMVDVKMAFQNILKSLERNAGINAKDENFNDTPARVAKAWGEIFSGMFDTEDQLKEIISKAFPSKSSEMIVQGPIEVWSVCPHHFLPVNLEVWIGYIPDRKVIGLSKLARIAELLAKKPALQEDTTWHIAEALFNGLGSKGVGCMVRGRHLCMEMRGVKKSAVTTTSSLLGNFLNPEVRAEFLGLVRGEK